LIKDSKLTKVRIDTKDNYKLGIFFIIISSLCFSLMAVMVKYVRHLPLMKIVFFQNIPTMIIAPLILKKMQISFLGNNKPNLWLHGLVGMITQLAKSYTFTIMLLTDATTTKAYQMAKASLVSLYTYSQIIFSSIFGLFFFKEISDLLSIIGASFIIISGYFNYRWKVKD
jgi:drug/metabolite transporter (DMT)-like permease